MKTETLLKALGNQTRMQLVKLLLTHNYCVRALAKETNLAESTVSEHLKILREAGLLRGEQKGHYMHYTVCRLTLRELAMEIEQLSQTEWVDCPESVQEQCATNDDVCDKAGSCDDATKDMCHGSHA